MKQSLCAAFKVSATAQLHRYPARISGGGSDLKLLYEFSRLSDLGTVDQSKF